MVLKTMDSSDKFMRVFVMFDLPTNTKAERAVANQFRGSLLKRGFYRLQYSVYVKICNGHESAKNVEKSIEMFVPSKGAVRIMVVTEKQYAAMSVILGPKCYQESFFENGSILFF